MLTTDSFNAFVPNGKSKDELSMDDIMGLLKNKRVDDPLPEIQYSEEDIKELEDFCQKNGIVGFNCGNMSPKVALKILKGKVGDVNTEIRNLESQGYTVVGKNYNHTKQLLNG